MTPFLAAENTSGFDGPQLPGAACRRDHEATLKRLEEKSLAAAEPWLAEREIDPQPWLDAVAEVRDRQRGNAFTAARNLMLKRGVPEDRFPAADAGVDPAEIGLERIARKGLERLGWELDRYEPVALSGLLRPDAAGHEHCCPVPGSRWADDAGGLEATCILTGGDPFAGGAPVRPGVLSVLAEGRPVEVPEDRRPSPRARRLDRPGDNPPDDAGDREPIWLWHLAEPLAGNPNNFGSTGKRPTHQELLDWLAATFVEEEWSMKELHRVILRRPPIVAQQSTLIAGSWRSSIHRGRAMPSSRPRRLSAEEMRDARLAATGELNRTLGGIPNRPEINLESGPQAAAGDGDFRGCVDSQSAPEPATPPVALRSQAAGTRRSLSTWRRSSTVRRWTSPCERREALDQ